MMTEQVVADIGLSMEAIPSGRAMPDWLLQSLIDGRRLMIIHPSEECRKQTIQSLYEKGNGKSVDTSHHLTVKRLIGVLHLDLRLPILMEDDGVLFEKTHRALSESAKNHAFPLLLSNPKNRWSRSRSLRLLTLYRELTKLRRPWDWQEDPGAKSCDKVLKSMEKESNSTHPYRLNRTVLQTLKEIESPPFTIADVEGIIVLDHPSGLSEVEISILQQISKFTGVHQLVNPGSHRLGFHGEYIEDIAPIRKNSELPKWIPKHEVWAPSNPTTWNTKVGENRGREINRLTCESSEHSHLALAEVLSQIDGEIVVVCGDAEGLRTQMQPHLESMGIKMNQSLSSLSNSAAVSRIISFTKLPHGEEAWSLNKLSDMWAQIELPMEWPILDLQHPTEEDWKPRLHPHVLSEIARGFHLLGGRGALRRWYSTLANSKPRPGVNEKQRAQELEESQWWLACIANWMNPILSKYDKEIASKSVTGCSSGSQLPLPNKPKDITDWINSCYEQINWEELAQRDQISADTLPGLQHLMKSLNKMQEQNIKFESEEFSEILEVISTNSQIPSSRSEDRGIKILSPSQAYGLECDFLILCGIDSETWSMRSPQIPWMDEAARMKMGLHRPDEPLRIARHQLRHFLNCAKNVVIIDSTIEDGVELSGPLDEWMGDISKAGLLSTLNSEPGFLPNSSWQRDTPDRAWELRKDGDISRLVYRVVSMDSTKDGVRTHRSGNLNRDVVQRSGISSLESRNPSSTPLNPNSLIVAAEYEVLENQFSRRRLGDDLEIGETYQFSAAADRIQSSDLKLIPTKTKPAIGRQAEIWPNLGIMNKRGLSAPIDPRPISPPSTKIDLLDNITGRASIKLRLPKVWSQGRLQSWLECPRRAWFERHMYLGKAESLGEDLAAATRGDIIHQIAENILLAHGIKDGEISSNPKSLVYGNLGNVENAWGIALQTLEKNATWMRREDGISAHRCRDLIGVAPNIWKEYLEHGTPIELGGRIGRMIESDFSMTGVAPIAVEWSLKSGSDEFVSIGLPESEKTFKLRGRIDRVDQLLFPENELQSCEDVIPLDFETGNPPRSNRLVILRDIKSIDGAKDNGENQRHLKGIFDELQLALYARAWEVANPGDRVIGVGATQVGNQTNHFVEIDPEYYEQCLEMSIGIVGNDTHEHYRIPGSSRDDKSNPFRAWMRERITTAMRVIDSAESGNIHPEPSRSCDYCSIIDACPSAKRGV